MTVVPDESTMTLICDGCGDTAASTAVVLPDAEVVWTLVSEHGWSGSPFATGPHRCPRCTSLPLGGGAPRDGGQILGVDYLDEVGGRAPLDGQPETEALRVALTEAVDTGARVIVDLTDVDHIDSTGLGLLVRARQEVRQRRAVMCLVAPSRFVLTVLHTMRLDGAFPMFPTRREALNGPFVEPSEVSV